LDEPSFIEAYRLQDYSPVIDFQRDAVVVAHRGACPSAGFGVAIAGVALDRGALVVKVDFEDPAPGVMTAAVITYPRAVGLIERSQLPEGLGRMSIRFIGTDGKTLATQRGVGVSAG
jgi:hypothetical protein